MNQGIRVKGMFVAKKFNEQRGVWEVVVRKENLVVDLGLSWFPKALDGDNPDLFTYLAVGTDSTATVTTMTGLVTEIARQPIVLTSKNDNEWKASAEFPAGTGTGVLREFGLFDDSPGGVMFNRVVSNITKGAGDNFSFEFTITFTNN